MVLRCIDIGTATTVTVPEAGIATVDAVLVRSLTLLSGRAATATDQVIPLPGIAVRVYDATTSVVATKTVTGATARTTSPICHPAAISCGSPIPAGTYGLTWYPYAATIAGALPVVVGTGSPARADVLLWPTSDLTGTVSSSTGPRPGIDVRLYDANTGALVAKAVPAAERHLQVR